MNMEPAMGSSLNNLAPSELSNEETSLAIKLLQSTDIKIAEGARRIFSDNYMPPAQYSNLVPTDEKGTISNILFPEIIGNNIMQMNQYSKNHQLALHLSSMLTSYPSLRNEFVNPVESCSTVIHTSNPSIQARSSLEDGITSFDEQQYVVRISPSHHAPSMIPKIQRLKRSRERNRMHARRTRQRKKEHLQNLLGRANLLKEEQLQLKQDINDDNTAKILLVMCKETVNHTDSNLCSTNLDPRVEELLKRVSDDIPCASKIPELPTLLLPSHMNKKRNRNRLCILCSPESLKQLDNEEHEEFPNDGIDYDLLRKDRSICTPAELDKIRRERNRMHAKRTRDRKRIFMEEMEDMIKELEGENAILRNHMTSLKSHALSTAVSVDPVKVSPVCSP